MVGQLSNTRNTNPTEHPGLDAHPPDIPKDPRRRPPPSNGLYTQRKPYQIRDPDGPYRRPRHPNHRRTTEQGKTTNPPREHLQQRRPRRRPILSRPPPSCNARPNDPNDPNWGLEPTPPTI